MRRESSDDHFAAVFPAQAPSRKYTLSRLRLGYDRSTRRGGPLVSSRDVAALILQEQGEMSTWKLQKLVYYSQAWHLAWDDEPLFSEGIEAWANGPVVRDLYTRHRGRFIVDQAWGERVGDPDKLAQSERDTIEAVLSGYAHLSGRQLSQLTHSEDPWKNAREGLGPTDRSSRAITLDSLHAYYSALDAANDAEPVEALDWDF
jgi:uncharacterized phage-associated protein